MSPKSLGLGAARTVAVDHVDFAFHEGEIVSIVGESGSGKTTLAKMLLGLISITEGEIYFQGKKRDISSGRKKQEYWNNIQAIFQDPVLGVQYLPQDRFRAPGLHQACAAAASCRGKRKSS